MEEVKVLFLRYTTGTAVKILRGTLNVCFVICCFAAVQPTLYYHREDSFTSGLLLTFLIEFRPEGHRKLSNKIRTLKYWAFLPQMNSRLHTYGQNLRQIIAHVPFLRPIFSHVSFYQSKQLRKIPRVYRIPTFNIMICSRWTTWLLMKYCFNIGCGSLMFFKYFK